MRAQVVWVRLQVQCMSAKVRRMIDLGSIYIKKIGTSGKIPARVLANPQPLDPHHAVECGG